MKKILISLVILAMLIATTTAKADSPDNMPDIDKDSGTVSYLFEGQCYNEWETISWRHVYVYKKDGYRHVVSSMWGHTIFEDYCLGYRTEYDWATTQTARIQRWEYLNKRHSFYWSGVDKNGQTITKKSLFHWRDGQLHVEHHWLWVNGKLVH